MPKYLNLTKYHGAINSEGGIYNNSHMNMGL